MYSPASARLVATSPVMRQTQRQRPLGLRTQMMARGPGWRLANGEADSWVIKLLRGDDPIATWAHLLRAVRGIVDMHGMHATIVDLRDTERLAGASAQAAALLFAEFENRGVRVAAWVGPDLIHAARVHRLLSEHASAHGRCFLTEDDALDWLRRSAPPVPPPLRVGQRKPSLQPPRV